MNDPDVTSDDDSEMDDGSTTWKTGMLNKILFQLNK